MSRIVFLLLVLKLALSEDSEDEELDQTAFGNDEESDNPVDSNYLAKQYGLTDPSYTNPVFSMANTRSVRGPGENMGPPRFDYDIVGAVQKNHKDHPFDMGNAAAMDTGGNDLYNLWDEFLEEIERRKKTGDYPKDWRQDMANWSAWIRSAVAEKKAEDDRKAIEEHELKRRAKEPGHPSPGMSPYWNADKIMRQKSIQEIEMEKSAKAKGQGLLDRAISRLKEVAGVGGVNEIPPQLPADGAFLGEPPLPKPPSPPPPRSPDGRLMNGLPPVPHQLLPVGPGLRRTPPPADWPAPGNFHGGPTPGEGEPPPPPNYNMGGQGEELKGIDKIRYMAMNSPNAPGFQGQPSQFGGMPGQPGLDPRFGMKQPNPGWQGGPTQGMPGPSGYDPGFGNMQQPYPGWQGDPSQGMQGPPDYGNMQQPNPGWQGDLSSQDMPGPPGNDPRFGNMQQQNPGWQGDPSQGMPGPPGYEPRYGNMQQQNPDWQGDPSQGMQGPPDYGNMQQPNPGWQGDPSSQSGGPVPWPFPKGKKFQPEYWQKGEYPDMPGPPGPPGPSGPPGPDPRYGMQQPNPGWQGGPSQSVPGPPGFDSRFGDMQQPNPGWQGEPPQV